MKLETKSKAILAAAFGFFVAALTLSVGAAAQQQRGGGGAGGGGAQGFPQPAGAREVTVKAIPGVVADGATWSLVWGGADNADGIVGTKDGGVIFAQEQGNHVGKLDKDGKYSVLLQDTHGAGALAIDAQGRILAVERTCTDPGKHPDQCTEQPVVGVLSPEHKTLADSYMGKPIARPGDLVVDKKGGVYFNAGPFFGYVSPSGQVSSIGENLRTNGIALSPDEKTLYVTNGMTMVAFDVQPDGSVKNQRDFAKLEGGGQGDGTAVDSMGRLYVSTGPGVQVIGPDGTYLGIIPSPRTVISVAFSGPDKKTLYMVGGGMLGPDGSEYKAPEGERNNAKSIFKIPVLTAGVQGRAK